MRCANDLARAETPPPVPPIPSPDLARPSRIGWTRPNPKSPEGRLLAHLIQHGAEYDRPRLLSHLVHPHPAIRAEVLSQLGRKMKGSGDPETLEALRSRLESEQDPIVRSAVKTALRDVSGQEAP